MWDQSQAHGPTSNEDEQPRAYVVPRQMGALSEVEVVKFVEARVAKVKRITGGVEFVDAIPKNPVRCSLSF
jgi:AMP-binding enzyme C-terminal domain